MSDCIKSREQAGQALIELVLIMPLLLLILVGLIDVGRLCYAAIEVASAARAGVQYGALDPSKATDLAGVACAAKQDATDITGAKDSTCTPAVTTGLTVTAQRRVCQDNNGTPKSCAVCATGTCSVSSPIEVFVDVTTKATVHTLIPWPGLPASVTLNGRATMRAQ